MLVSCKYCGGMHERGYICPQKPHYEPKTKYHYNRDSEEDKLRGRKKWKLTREYIRNRDMNLCQLCFRDYPGSTNRFMYCDLSVHHIIPLEENMDLAYEPTNLITLCRRHHDAAEKGAFSTRELRAIAKEQEAKNGKTGEDG